ncbi:MAG: F0F1 ATP synthase subunit A, partial [Pseudomonadota bacterium]
MKQFQIEPIFGQNWEPFGGFNIAFTNSALWMAVTVVLLWVFVYGGMKRELVPGRWQMAVETMTGFIDDMLAANIGTAGRKYVPYIFSLFMFILFGNLLGLL